VDLQGWTNAAGAKILEERQETEYGSISMQPRIWTATTGCFSHHAKGRSPEEWGAVTIP
jgi:hypothetical protein